MPFMKGTAPIRRTKAYLEAGKLMFKQEIRVMTINYNLDQQTSKGAYDFIFWYLPQLKYKNGHLQVLKFKNMTPTPFIQFFFNTGERVLVDIYAKDRFQIHDHLKNTFCETDETLQEMKKRDATLRRKIYINPANFGYHCNRWCICEIPGQVPCPGFVPLPKTMRGKYFGKSAEEIEES